MKVSRRLAAAMLWIVATSLPAAADRGGVALGWLVATGPAPDLAAEARAFATEAPGADGSAGDAIAAGHPLLPLVAGADPADSAGGEGDAAAMRLSLGAAFDAEVLRYRRGRPVPESPEDAAAPFRAIGIAGLRDLIASVESGRAGYDAIHHSAKRLPPKKPSQMTIAEIQAWIAETPGQQHAIGRYQVVPKTLKMLVARLDLPGSAIYSPALQDRMADSLLDDAGLPAFLAGSLSRESFMTNVAAIWAGLPAANGRSVYHGYAGNYAGISWKEYQARLAEAFPQ